MPIDSFRVNSKKCITHVCKACYCKYLSNYRTINKVKINYQKKQWYLDNRDQNKSSSNTYCKQYRKSNPNARLSHALRTRLKAVLNGKVKKISAIKDLGCTVNELKAYLESKFLPGMSWENYGFRGWHIDHIVPFCKFDLTDIEQQRAVCHYTNLQPMWWQDNLKKGGR